MEVKDVAIVKTLKLGAALPPTVHNLVSYVDKADVDRVEHRKLLLVFTDSCSEERLPRRRSWVMYNERTDNSEDGLGRRNKVEGNLV
jgi:hypothetical protein